MLTAVEFHQLADVRPRSNGSPILATRARDALTTAIRDFMRFTGIARPEEFRQCDAGAHPCGAMTWCVVHLAAGTGSRRAFRLIVTVSALQLIVFTSNFISPTVPSG